ncbi:ParB family protein [Klebsiella pneumoniae]|uniref:ParB family protein n=1 Tax=Klebsiella pneumoniae TaxID=573 RepID=UPI0030D04F00
MKSSNMKAALLKRGREPAAVGNVAVLPVAEMPMVLMLEQLRPNPDNPRTTRNPKYEEIKSSIHARGLDSVPKVTKNPDSAEDVYIFSDGGNTRYAILSELYQETGDERFRRIQCIFKPWPGRLKCVIGHLAENEMRGDLSFIEKALGVAKARSIYEEQFERKVTQQELADLLTGEGYRVTQSNISRMEYAVTHLFPHLSSLFYMGLSRTQVLPLINLYSAAEKGWKVLCQESAVLPLAPSFEVVFASACSRLELTALTDYSLEYLKDELMGELVKALPDPTITWDRWLIELDPAVLWSSFFGHADQMVGLCTGGQLGGRAGQRFVLCG